MISVYSKINWQEKSPAAEAGGFFIIYIKFDFLFIFPQVIDMGI